MSKPFALQRLPSSIREELLKRRADKPVLTLDDHFIWLTSQGHQVSRSAIYRFLAAHDEQQASPDDSKEPADAQSIRLGCLMVAAAYAVPGDKIDLIKTADEFVEWVAQTDPS
ncbi:hypothetical protein [Ectopseudomonas toyotomiensis]|uniref:Uncharacterized protein n=1 Tax=Ectopseudomonas toyotomiensis TaxID=554344 RepID=A0AA42IJ16_9GAMM|nr:hypothetical protein [Pseudomonas toyotomiensis]MBG0838870.1 hypothetical protein [Pseudomonas toyotomiensis]MDH0700055.1 hypothetical protein [Pseudomonas toyotomiensis]